VNTDLALAFAVFALAWIGGASIGAVCLCRRWKKADRRMRKLCAFDPIATAGIERGDFKGMKIGGRR
jgi:hypothetical protein